MMKRFILFCTAVICLVSCKSGKQDNVPASFLYNGANYATLQEALDAATLPSGNALSGEIMLTGDMTGNGAAVRASYTGYLCIDFGSHRYVLNQGESINTSNAEAVIKAHGGALRGDGTILSSMGGSLTIEGEIDIEGDLECYAPAWIGKDFKGRFAGNLTIADEFKVLSRDITAKIDELYIHGDKGFIQIDEIPAAPVEIGNVYPGKVTLPVCADKAGAVTIGSGATLHVHNYVGNTIPATCITPQTEMLVCECGYTRYERGDEYSEKYGKCPVGLLVYHPQEPATETRSGHVSYWECPLCGAQYLDEKGERPVSGTAALLATNYLTDPAILYDLDKELYWQREFEEQTEVKSIAGWGIALAIIGLAETFGMSLPALVASDTYKWNDVHAKLDEIQKSLDRIEAKITELAYKVDAVAYKELAITRNDKFNFLKTYSVAAFNTINDILKKNEPDEMKQKEISDVLVDWSKQTYSQPIADVTHGLMQQYSNTGLPVNVPSMFEAIANCSYMWEHDGYNFRYQALLQDVSLSTISYIMACHYINSVAEYKSEAMRKEVFKAFQNDFKQYENTVKAELDRIKQRDGQYRRLNNYGITFQRQAKTYDFRKWFANNRNYGFPRENQDGNAVASCEKVLSDLGLNRDLGFTQDMAKDIYAFYNRNHMSKPVSIYTILTDSVHFIGLPGKFDPGIIVAYKGGGFGHENNDVAIPVYKIFHWESYRSSNYGDYFGIRTCLNDKTGCENHNFLYKCDISSYSSGHINSLGEETRWIWYTLVKAD